MYPDEKFLVSDLDEIRAFVEQYPFATLVATDHARALNHSPKIFVSFLGPDAPILGSWQLTARFGGTWNYQAVHVRGTTHGRDRDTLLAHLEDLKNRFETSPDHKFQSLPLDYVDGLLPHIECIDIVVSDLKCIFKLSQNRRIEEFDRTVENLASKGGKSALVAEEMQIRRERFYPR